MSIPALRVAEGPGDEARFGFSLLLAHQTGGWLRRKPATVNGSICCDLVRPLDRYLRL
jgi:hypothetical protein